MLQILRNQYKICSLKPFANTNDVLVLEVQKKIDNRTISKVQIEQMCINTAHTVVYWIRVDRERQQSVAYVIICFDQLVQYMPMQNSLYLNPHLQPLCPRKFIQKKNKDVCNTLKTRKVRS